MNDVAVVTGAASGVGACTVSRLVKRGYDVISVDLASAPNSEHVRHLQADVADVQTWARVLEVAREEFGAAPNVVVLNAAYLTVGTVVSLSDDDWRRVFEVNVFGAVRALRTLIPAMIERGGGSIVTIGSVDSFMAEQGLVAYCASKGAIVQLTRTIAMDHARDGIRANCVCPGVIDTPFFRRHLATASDPERFVKMREQRNPLGRLLDPDEVAATIEFLAGPESSGTTGATIVVDAGLTASFDFRTGEEGS